MSRNSLVVPLMLALAACAGAPDRVVSEAAPGPVVTSPAAPPAPLIPAPAPAPMVPAPVVPAPPAAMAPGAPLVTPKPAPSAAGWAVSIIGTPFALAFKTVVCGASLVIAAPVAGFLTLGVDPYGEGYEVLGDGIAQNCGPPYVVSPYAAS